MLQKPNGGKKLRFEHTYTRHNNTKWPVIYDHQDTRSHKFWKPQEKHTKINVMFVFYMQLRSPQPTVPPEFNNEN